MPPDWHPGKDHELFTDWAKSQGIAVNGVSPARFPGRGLGMIATRNIKEGEVMVAVPHSAMFTVNCIPSAFIGQFPDGISVHGILAAFLTHGDADDLDKYALWRRTWPSRQDFEESMPVLWPEGLRGSQRDDSSGQSQSQSQSSQTNFLPPSISGRWNTLQTQGGSSSRRAYETAHQNLLTEQQKRLQTAWDTVVAVFPETDWAMFSYHWLIVNTRSFYYLMPGQSPPEDSNDAMALLPFADYFNHSDVACDVRFDGEVYVFRAAKSYEKGEEVYMSYGPHPNDFLLAEYGFFLDENDSEAVYLDDIIFHDLSSSQQEELELGRYYGNYQLTTAGVCFRTEIAACLKYMTREDWRSYILGFSTKKVNARKTEAIIQGWVKAYAKEADTTIAALKSSSEPRMHLQKAEVLLKRWCQIKRLCDQVIKSMSN